MKETCLSRNVMKDSIGVKIEKHVKDVIGHVKLASITDTNA